MKKIKKQGKNQQVNHNTTIIIMISGFLMFTGVYLLLVNNNRLQEAFSQDPQTKPNYYCVGPNNCGYSTNSITNTKIIISQTPCNTTAHARKNNGGSFLEQILNFFIQLINTLLNQANTTTTTTPCNPIVVPSQSVAMLTPTMPVVLTQPAVISVAPVTQQTAPLPTISPIPTVTTVPAVGQTVNIAATNGGNYSGYSYNINAPAINDTVQGSWNAVPVNCSTSNIVSPWVGMGDLPATEQNLAQLGIDFDCSGGSLVYAAWTEALPADSVYYPNDTINAGDQITASVTYQGNGTFATKMSDAQQKWTITLPMNYGGGYKAQGGEFIFEDLLGNGIPNYSPVTFMNSMFSLGSLTQLQPLSSGQGLIRYNFMHANTSTLTGSTFTVTY